MEMKQCNKCKGIKTLTRENFYISAAHKGGFRHQCITCCKKADSARRNSPERKLKKAEYDKLHQKVHRERYTEYMREYRVKNKDKIVEYLLNYKEIYRPRKKEYDKEYRKLNKARIKKSKKLYRANNKHLSRAQWQRRQALVRNLPNTLTIEEWEQAIQYFDGKCVYCKGDSKLEQDHFIPVIKNGGYERGNIVPSCKSCNSSKKDRDFFEWYKEQEFYCIKQENKITLNLINVKI